MVSTACDLRRRLLPLARLPGGRARARQGFTAGGAGRLRAARDRSDRRRDTRIAEPRRTAVARVLRTAQPRLSGHGRITNAGAETAARTRRTRRQQAALR